MIIGPPYFLAASRQPEMEQEDTTLTAGMAYSFSFACASRSVRAWPVTTPGLTVAGSGVTVLVAMVGVEVRAGAFCSKNKAHSAAQSVHPDEHLGTVL